MEICNDLPNLKENTNVCGNEMFFRRDKIHQKSYKNLLKIKNLILNICKIDFSSKNMVTVISIAQPNCLSAKTELDDVSSPVTENQFFE